MMSPLPIKLRLSLAAITGSPLAPSMPLSAAVRVNVLSATNEMVFDPPTRLAALMSAIRSETVAAVKFEGTVLSSSRSRRSRRPRRRDPAGRTRPGADRPRKCWYNLFNHMVVLRSGAGLRYNEMAIAPGAQTERPGDAGPVRASLGG